MMMRTREIIRAATAATAATVVMTGCSNEAPAPAMYYTYELDRGVDAGLVEVQRQLGQNAVESVTSEPLTFQLGDQKYTGTMRVPENVSARTQHILFSPDSSAHWIKSDISVRPDENGIIQRVDKSSVVIGQEKSTGVVYSAVFGYCEPLELATEPPITDALAYNAAVDAVCNGLANAAEYSVGEQSYQNYVTNMRLTNRVFTSDPIPLVSERQFRGLTLD